jgi:toxin ParE1/3/4
VNRRYVLKPKADLDVEVHADYLANHAGLEVALRFLSSCDQTFALLAKQPNIGWHSRLRHAALHGVRIFRVSGFETMLILYRPLADGVEILRVVHGSRDLEALLRRRGEIQ